MAVVNRKSVRLAAEDRVHQAIDASRAKHRLPTHGDDTDRESREARWASFHERLHAVVADAMHSPAAFNQFVAAVAALARYDAGMAQQLHDAVPTESKRGRRPQRTWRDDEIVGLYEFFLTCAKANGERYPKAVARRELTEWTPFAHLSGEAIRSIVRRSRSVK